MNTFEMLRNLPAMKQKAEEIRVKVKQLTATGESGAGLVRVTMNGDFEVTDICIDPALVGSKDSLTTLEVLVASATNSAASAIKHATEDLVRREAGAMGLGDFGGFGL